MAPISWGQNWQSSLPLLELGCGTGSTTITHAPYVKYILAIDISSKKIDLAQGKAVFIVAKRRE